MAAQQTQQRRLVSRRRSGDPNTDQRRSQFLLESVGDQLRFKVPGGERPAPGRDERWREAALLDALAIATPCVITVEHCKPRYGERPCEGGEDAGVAIVLGVDHCDAVLV